MVKVITINILFDLDTWLQRRDLLVAELAAEQPDLIGIQEVNLEEDTDSWLAEQLNMPYVYRVPFTERAYQLGPKFGVAILSRHPFTQQAQLDLQSQGRFAQYVQVEINQCLFVFCNGHYYWKIGSSPERMKQFQLLLNWLAELPAEMPVIAVGDFNATPDMPEIVLMRDRFTSAYTAAHGHEPDYTCPTPLIKPKRPLWKSITRQLISAWMNRTFKPWRGTLDYIFISRHWAVRNCRVILTEPALDTKKIYPSDHFGIVAELD